MSNRQKIAKWSYGVLLIFLIASGGCQKTKPKAPEFAIGRSVFSFDPGQINTLELSKQDARSSDYWTARLKRVADPNAKVFFALENINVEPPFVDKNLDYGFMAHLLDTLRTLKAVLISSDQNSEHLGLEKPRYQINMSLEGSPSMIRLEVGNFIKNDWEGSAQAYAYLEDSAHRVPQGGQKVAYVIEGATLKMLELIKSSQAIRQTKLMLSDEDQVETLFIGAWNWNFERAGTQFVLLGKKILARPAVDQAVSAWSHLRIKSFLDEKDKQTEAVKLMSLAKQKIQIQFGISSSPGNPLSQLVKHKIDFACSQGRCFAKSTERGDQVFELYPEAQVLLKQDQWANP